jgi:hypothetical protein
MDHYVDFVGMPVPDTADGKKNVVFCKRQEVLQSSVLIFDEINRAPLKTRDGVLEVMLFGTVNQEPLPNFRCVVAMINPKEGGYQVDELDPAFVARFQLVLNMDGKPSAEWFEQRFGAVIGSALYDWWLLDLDANQKEVVNPRKLEDFGKVHAAAADLELVLPHENLPVEELRARLGNESNQLEIQDFMADPVQFADKVTQDIDVAYRFAFLMPHMSKEQMAYLRDVVLALPAEILATLKAELPGTYQLFYDAVAEQVSRGVGKSYRARWLEKIQA